jgi:hypothetical protein
MGIDQTGDDPTAGHIHLTCLPRELEAGALANRFYSPATHHHDSIRQRRSTCSVDERCADQRDAIVGSRLAPQEKQAGYEEPAGPTSEDHWKNGRGESSTPAACAPLSA